MKFDVILGNPPYHGKGNPLYMQITKTLYDNNMDENSVMCMINPTGLVDNKYIEKDDKNYKRYKYLKLVDFYYDSSLRSKFKSADIGNDVAIFTYRKDGTMSIFDDDVKEKRFGKDYIRDKSLIESFKNHSKIADLDDFGTLNNGDKDTVEVFLNKRNNKGKYFVVCSYIRGHIDNKTGGHKWDWTTLLNSINFVVKTELYDISMNVASFDNRDDAVNLIKWLNTDFLQYIILYYKTQMTNNNVLFRNLPQPPTSGDYSDESICKEFGMEMSDMEYIHEKMKNYGWKTKHNEDFISDYSKVGYKLPSIKLDGTEKTLLKFIDELNILNKDIELSDNDYVNGILNDTIEDQSPSTSNSLPKTIYDLELKKLDPFSNIQKDKKYDEEDLKKAYQ